MSFKKLNSIDLLGLQVITIFQMLINDGNRFTWYHPSVWGAAINQESKMLLLQNTFEVLNVNRVEFHVDSRNEHSIQAKLKLGAVKKGVLRKHKIVQDTFVRDTEIFSIVNVERTK